MDEMIGRKFGMLTVEEYVETDKDRCKTYLCLCDCGCDKILKGTELRRGSYKSCGCLSFTHRRSGTVEYQTYHRIKHRCYNTKDDMYYRYGGRGIKMCDRWLESFENLYEDMGNKPSKEYQIDRIDNDGDYSPENCHWATPSENSVNRTSKPNKTKHKGLRKDGDSYRTKVTRDKHTRLSLSDKNIENVIKLRDYYIEEFKNDKEKWIQDTINNTYPKYWEDISHD